MSVRVGLPEERNESPEERNETAAEVLPRIPFSELPPGLAVLLEPRVDRLGYLGEFFQATAHQPHMLEAFTNFTEAVKDGLDSRLVEIVALTVAARTGNQYELHQHERLSLRLGFDRTWVASLEELDPAHAKHLTDDDRQTQELVLALTDDLGRGARALVGGYAEEHGPQRTIGLLFAVGRYVLHSTIVHALQLTPPVPSIFEGGPDD